MSLVICSNNTDEQDPTAGTESSIFKPWSFRNDMSSSMTLPADCQVALQSAKIHMDGRVSLGDLSARTFYWWFGKCPEASMGEVSAYHAPDVRETTSQAVKVVLFEDQQGKVETDINGLRVELQDALNRACFHPNLHNRIEVETVFDAGTGQFTGFKFIFAEEIATAAFQAQNRIPGYADNTVALDALRGLQRRYQLLGPGAGRLLPPYTVNLVNPGAANAYLQMEMPAGVLAETQSICLNVPPLNLKGDSVGVNTRGGFAAFQISGVDTNAGANASKFACGLSRPCIENEGGDFRGLIYPSWYKNRNGASQPEWLNYYDYAVACNQQEDDDGAAGSQGKLRIFHSVVNSADQGGDGRSTSEEWKFTPKLQALRYGDGTGGTENTGCSPTIVGSANFSADYGYDFAGNPLNITGVLFIGSAQRITIQLYTLTLANAAHVKYTIATYDAARPKKSNLKPIDQGCWSLLPQMTMNNAGAAGGAQNFYVERFDGVDSQYTGQGKTWDLMSYGGAFRGALLNPTGARGTPGINEGRSSWELVNSTLRTSNDMVREINSRTMLDYNFLPNAAGTYLYDSVAATPQFNFVNQKQVLILEEQPVDNYPHTELANATGLLGFVGRAVVDFSSFDSATTYNWEVTSIQVPTILPTSSIFVRLHGFNQQSTNAKARGKSDIIAHLPRFDGLQSIGALYLEPNSLVYLDLNNPNPVQVNSFDLSLCYSNEQYAENLTGTTIIVLHFREKPK